MALILLVGSIGFGWARPYELAAIGANLGLFALLVAYPLQIAIDYKFMPKELRPHPHYHPSPSNRHHLVWLLPKRAVTTDTGRYKALNVNFLFFFNHLALS